ncbi:MAG: Rpn family recombination-promoting nuclease/putative transposase [Bacteroidota bacterium]
MAIHEEKNKFFKNSFGIKEVASDFIASHFKSVENLNMDTLALQPDSFIGDELKQLLSAVIYKVRTSDDKRDVFFLLTHQSANDPFMPVCALQYVSSIMSWDMKAQIDNKVPRKDVKVPVVYPFMIYSGQEPYNWPKEFSESMQWLAFIKDRT